MQKISTNINQTSNVSQKQDLKLEKVSKEFEQMLVNMMLKEMNKSIGNTGFLDNGPYEKMFKDRLTDERAKSIVDSGGFGISKQIIDQMQRGKKDLPNPDHKLEDAKNLSHQIMIDKVASEYRFMRK